MALLLKWGLPIAVQLLGAYLFQLWNLWRDCPFHEKRSDSSMFQSYYSVAKSGVVDNLLSWVDFKQNKELKKTDGTRNGGRISDIKKLEEPNLAGKAKAGECTLILTEGDSAKALAKAWISVVGSNTYGVFPLRGKLLNVREACHKQIMDNAEIQHIKIILGMQRGKQYDSVKGLRYGHLMTMTDQVSSASTSASASIEIGVMEESFESWMGSYPDRYIYSGATSGPLQVMRTAKQAQIVLYSTREGTKT